MTVQTLNGIWSRRVGGGNEAACAVPYSTLPVGRSTCTKSFSVLEGYDRIFIKFDGITYRATVTLNGKLLGEMLPYCEYEFEITDAVTARDNKLCVEIEDLDLSFGPTAGWENYGGIIRDVSLIYRDENYITDVFFKSRLVNGYKDAYVCAEISTDKPSGRATVELISPCGFTVLSYTQEVNEVKENLLEDVTLWSPDSPALYTLRVSLADGNSADLYECKVGLREIKCERHRFLLNGEPVFLKGVCKHEFIGDSGHVVPKELILKDMEMIKSTGANFVRLVHYPHSKATLEIADSLGLMVSEEPGLWWSDTSNEEVANGSLEVLKRTIIRDRNHASIAFWLCFNECYFTEKFLIDSAATCKRYDPTRLVSGANCMSDEDTLIYYNRCNFDFYTMHPYSASFARSQKAAQILHDKPLVFTEWGGYFVFDNLPYMRECLQKMGELYRANSDEGALAGALLWCWADLNDFNRGAPCVDGLLSEGLVTKDRQKHFCYDLFCEEIAKIDKPLPPTPYELKLLAEVGGNALTLTENGGDIWELAANVASEERAVPFRLSPQRQRKIINPPILKDCEKNSLLSLPAVSSVDKPAVFEGNTKGNKITLVGAVSFSKGYPIAGKLDEEAARVTVFFEDGKQSFVLRNGRELTTVFATIGSSRIDPRADNAPRFAELSYDKNFEQYVINKLELDLGETRRVTRVEISSIDGKYTPLTYGCFVE